MRGKRAGRPLSLFPGGVADGVVGLGVFEGLLDGFGEGGVRGGDVF